MKRVCLFVFCMIAGWMISELCDQKADGAERRNGVYIPTRPGDPMYSYYTGDYGNRHNEVRRAPQPRYQRPHVAPPRYNYVTPPRFPYIPQQPNWNYQPHNHYVPPFYDRPNINVYPGRHGRVTIGFLDLDIKW
jgi:hypothetical protein